MKAHCEGTFTGCRIVDPHRFKRTWHEYNLKPQANEKASRLQQKTSGSKPDIKSNRIKVEDLLFILLTNPTPALI